MRRNRKRWIELIEETLIRAYGRELREYETAKMMATAVYGRLYKHLPEEP